MDITLNIYYVIMVEGVSVGKNTKKLNQSGQAVTEYILLLSILLVGVGALVSKIRDGSDIMAAKSGAKLEKMLRTGSAPPSIWTK